VGPLTALRALQVLGVVARGFVASADGWRRSATLQPRAFQVSPWRAFAADQFFTVEVRF
jgi:hypothetical protein